MSQAKNLFWLALGATLLAASLRSSAVGRPAMWLALPLLLHAFRSMPVRAALGALGIALYGALVVGNRGQIPVAGPVYFAIVLPMALVALFPFVVDRWTARRFEGLPATLAFPAAWVTEEFLRSRVPGGPETWGSIAYTQYGDLAIMQLVGLTGIWGISFLLAWFAAVASAAWTRRSGWEGVRRSVVVFAAVLGGSLLSGGARLAFAPEATATVRVAAVTLPRGLFAPGEMFRIADGRASSGDAETKLARLHEWFFTHTEREALAGARLVAWPEMNFLVSASDEPAALERAKRLAVSRGIYLSMGLGTVTAGAAKPFENKAVLVDPSGRVVYAYRKSRPVLGWEARVMRTGDGRLPMAATALGRVSTAICFDNDAPELVRQVGRGQADLWILPANDWEAISRVHFEMAVFRAIENGTPILRAAANGFSGVIDPWGRVVAVTDHRAGAPTFVADLPLGRAPTLYALIGDTFAWGCVLACAGMAALALATPLPASASPGPPNLARPASLA